jgi:hypothetical protein
MSAISDVTLLFKSYGALFVFWLLLSSGRMVSIR